MLFRVRALVLLAAQAAAASAFVVPGPAGVVTGARPTSSTRMDMATAADEEQFHRALLGAHLKYEGRGSAPAPAAAAAAEAAPKKKGGGKKQRRPKNDGPTVYVGNLSFDAKEEDVREIFEPHGSIASITVPPDRTTGRCRGFAFVTMEDRAGLDKAVDALDQTQFQGRTLYVNESKPKEEQKKDLEASKLYVGNISYDTTKEDLVEYFGGFGTVVDVYVPRDRSTGSPRGFAFVNMAEADISAAIDGTDGEVYKGRSLTVSVSLPRGQKAPPREKRDTKLYVGNLSFYTDVDAVRSLFEEYGEVKDCYMPSDRETGRPRGFAFVTMDPEAAMRAADETDGYEMDGRIIRVNEAQPKGYSNDGGGDSWDEGDDSWEN
mmetsp:Transcript_38649/g.116069  ORF Transcript_38649/g.116069 Transcript_38649/m.116069 type:complete len:377 (-) Transcript_38649:454-1584(-)|eukprot:CAMPEP_0113540702 /NCGR_PEP_ID=MMETSP0015_2-20120614/8626_1 /TAXON_ID=2838 /ORGANISM="Odontella" /LENGTH=376 /DNA_ID=CAMNT_0000440533 /DNA_START=131 /DNA_END=1261 /DNA_ORIENTATION=+ /assembly_acc=CAM_ASM_000160